MSTNEIEMPRNTEVLAFIHVPGRLVSFPSLTLSFYKITISVLLSYILVYHLLQDANISVSIACSLCSFCLLIKKIIFILPN
jgi:hypothetical protein